MGKDQIRLRNEMLTEVTDRVMSRCMSLEAQYNLDRAQTLGILQVVSMQLAMDTISDVEDCDCNLPYGTDDDDAP